jgi:ABC-2 type transport system ATP-binding protein
MIETHNLTRSFKVYEKSEGLVQSLKGFWSRKYIEKKALHETSLIIPAGQIVGLVGANGAGKTTLLKLLSGLIYPTSGEATVLGFKPWERNYDYLRKMSILLGQKNQLWWDIAPLDSFSLLTEIYDLEKTKVKSKIQDLAEMLNCTDVLKTQLRRLSLGERMKMEIIGALLHEPEILFLDEPTIGLDIMAQSTIRKFLTEYVKDKKPTVILTSHYMDDIAQLANRLLLISKGSIVYDGSVHEFVKNSEQKTKIVFSLGEPLKEDLKISKDLNIKAGLIEHEIEILKPDLPLALAKIGTLSQIHNLKIEEADFEEIIHRFLQKESGILSTRHHQ